MKPRIAIGSTGTSAATSIPTAAVNAPPVSTTVRPAWLSSHVPDERPTTIAAENAA